ncbi:MAG: hypothetical protein A3J10_04060 [Candidatus Sungbacteria bacterium RIFCSPLOWO2_02_FULL_54_10]|uniref:Uncharacterized protein n=2 Tax=Candidatus Sungiibacteriota TaxID=1817917 RepID=A0A1G2L9Q1_9BACT|nr:MAG: hypothetical protein A2679_02595 [Candidatus Sungbacteria bacterium RIFCSPHIGHO2_01_FULL_54_26]OHA02904.1 MAG: hypothetical protein A3C92_01570 [Candidatus Sungbacteria bacterium RIFCSPHIGHO2_02_FULL_53_17]OHA07542.1 MAG: hypothetical protein A3B34_01160 [Candidatus Sungbacteria bacterium RIFCSPLOWO2_01_FULL_54_21]OHA13047.1 MAG: hypothetical protein A3J10_04060 [Candidatus Sungbacteria bacterium RIFCSPLOWO2_02_FULL_54_10]
MSWHDKVLDAFLNAAKPTVEAKMEDFIGALIAIPQLRRLIEKNPDTIAAVLSSALGAIPEMDKRTIMGRFAAYGIDVAEILPRELVRAVKGQGTTRRGIKLNSGGATGGAPSHQKQGDGGKTILAKLPKKGAGPTGGSSILSKLPRR